MPPFENEGQQSVQSGAEAPANAGTPSAGVHTPAADGQQSQVPAGGEGEQQGAEGQQQAPKRNGDVGLQKRINTLTRQKYELQARLDALSSLNRGESPQQSGQQGGAASQQSGPPKLEDFNDFQKYLDAMVSYQVGEKLKSHRQTEETTTREQLTRQQQAEISQRWSESVSEFAEQTPDFEEVVEAADVNVSQALMHAIMDADEGPQVLYYLAQNPKEVRKLNGMGFAAVVRHIGRLEERLSGQQQANPGAVAPKSKAPKVPETVSGSGSARSNSGPADTMPIGDWMAAERERVRKKFART